MFTVIIDFLSKINDFIYFPVLVLLLISVGLYFTFKTGFVQIANFKDALHTIFEKPEGEDSVSSFQALMISTASRVGTGNIVGISTAICLGGYGAVFWMWLVAIIGGASAFIESTLAQIYKKGSQAGDSYGGPSYYIENALHNRKLGLVFAVCLILTYAIGFNMLASFNLRDSFEVYSFFDAKVTPYLVGFILAAVTGYCLFGGNQRIIQFTSFLVPFMGIIYIAVALFMTLTNITILPEIIKHIVADAFNFTAISGGIAGSSLVYGIKRGLFSNEAGIGSAPNAAAAADVSHPVKQGLVQMMSVFIDTLIICSATAFMCLSSGIAPDPSLAGAPYVQAALSAVLGQYGNLFITISLVLFGFTTIIGNLYYVDNNLYYIFGKMPSRRFMMIFRSFCVLLIFLGAIQEASAAWLIADLLMAIMALINLPTILILSKTALAALKDYKQQRQRKQNPTFYAKDIGLDDSTLDYWK